MEPRLRSGDFALFFPRRHYRVADIVLVAHPSLGLIVKQIRSLNAGTVTLAGTGAFSTSTERMGAVATSAIRGRLIWHIRP